jgi:response regulator RpfG family c-di-GMP phosphodiesterase
MTSRYGYEQSQTVIPNMSSHEAPIVLLVQDYDDANLVLSGVLSLKGCKVYKSTSGQGCLSIANELGDKVDLILIKKEIASSMNFMILNNIA